MDRNIKILESHKFQRLQALSKRDFEYRDLSEEEILKLSELIANLPVDKQSLLIFKYYYRNSYEEMGELLSIAEPEFEIIYLNSVLSQILEMNDKLISASSMEKASSLAAERINQDIMDDFQEYAEAVDEKEIPSLKAREFKGPYSWKTRTAHTFIYSFIVLFILIGANTFANGKIFEWFIQTYEKYTSFEVESETELTHEDFGFVIGYVPEGFKLEEEHEDESTEAFRYVKGKSYFCVTIYLDDKVSSFMNSEGASISEFMLDGSKVYFWEREGKSYFTSSKYAHGLQIFGDISKEEAILIYRGIGIKNK